MIKFKFVNHSYGTIESDDIYAFKDLKEQFSFYVPNYRFMPRYKAGLWDGKIHLINSVTRQFPVGIIQRMIDFCSNSNYEIEVDPRLLPKKDPELKQKILKFISGMKYYSKKQEITPRDDQIKAIVRAIEQERCVNVCPTSFGKSLCIFVETLWYTRQSKKVLLIVPAINLVYQFVNDITDYCTDESGRIASYIPDFQCIYTGQEKFIREDTELVITTWQSVYKLSSEWFNQFGAIILDEAHSAKANCLTSIFDKSTEVAIRTGWTGTLKKTTVPGIQVEALLGPIETITETATLMSEGVVADLTIQVVRFNYEEELVKELQRYFEEKRRVTGKHTYNDEIAFLENYMPRNQTIISMAGLYKKTGLLLYKHIKHGKDLYEIAHDKFPDRNIYRIDGTEVIRNDTKYKTYEELKPLIEKEKDAILICSFGVFSTGISIKNINYIFFTVPTKSYVRTIQSIGRGLRVSDIKTKLHLVDIVDDLCGYTKKGKRHRENYAFKHFIERFDMYSDQKFKYQLNNIQIR